MNVGNEIENFASYMEEFKKKTTKEKEDIIYEQLKVLTYLTNSYCKEIGSNNEIIVNKELLDLEKDDYTVDDYLEALVTLLSSVQNSFCDFHDRMINIVNEVSRNIQQ